MLGRQRQGALVDDLADTREQELSGRIGDDFPISIEWEDAGTVRLRGAPEPLAMLRPLDFAPPVLPFDAAFSTQSEG